MDHSLFAVLNDAVAADAARLSGRRFADARGAGIARRVRTRRTVRAVGAGGASAVAVGGIALGATHLPWGAFDAAPGVGGSDCATPWPAALTYNVVPRSADYLDESWSILDATTGEPLAGLAPGDSERTWVATYPSGETATFVGPIDGVLTVDITGREPLYLEVSEDNGVTVLTPTTHPGTQDGDCYTPSPSIELYTSLWPTPSPSQSPSLAAKPEDVIRDSPFECGFEFPSASQSVEGMAIEDTGWLTSAEVLTLLERRLNTNHDSSGNVVEGPYVPVTVHVDSTQVLPTFTLVDPAGTAVTGGYMGAVDPALRPPTIDGITAASGVEIKASVEGMTFVAVSKGVVIGTISDPWTPEEAPPVTWTHTEGPESLTLINPEGAFSACPGASLGEDVEIYAVAGRMTMDSDRVMTGPFYVWSEIARP